MSMSDYHVDQHAPSQPDRLEGTVLERAFPYGGRDLEDHEMIWFAGSLRAKSEWELRIWYLSRTPRYGMVIKGLVDASPSRRGVPPLLGDPNELRVE